MGSPALTSRGFVERDFEKVAEFVDRAVNIAGALDGKFSVGSLRPVFVGVWLDGICSSTARNLVFNPKPLPMPTQPALFNTPLTTTTTTKTTTVNFQRP